MISGMPLVGSVCARCSGTMIAKNAPILPSASGIIGNGCFRRNWIDLVGRRRQFVGDGEQRLAERVALAPALQAGNHVARTHRLAVVELQPVAQRDLPGLAVILDDMALDHLRLRLVALVQPVERVEHQAAVHDRRAGRRLDRVEQRQVLRRHEFQRGCGRGARQTRCREYACASRDGSEKRASFHGIRSFRMITPIFGRTAPLSLRGESGTAMSSVRIGREIAVSLRSSQ